MRSIPYALVLALAGGLTLFAGPGAAMMGDECFAGCDEMQSERDALHDSTDNGAAMNGGVTQSLSDMDDAIAICRAQCAALEAAQELFRDCVARNPDNEEWLDYCRDDYTANRPDNSW